MVKSEYDVFTVEHDPYKLTHLSTKVALNAPAAMSAAIADEEDDAAEHGGAGFAACDLVAYPRWAAHRMHHPGSER